MNSNFTIAERIIRDEYQRLCNLIGLWPVPLDIYVCDDNASEDKKTVLGFPLTNCTPCYSGSRRLMAIPLCEGDDWPHILPGFPPEKIDKHSLEWPTWRIELWHEVTHQISNDLFKTWEPKEPGRRLPNGLKSESGHGDGWFKGIKQFALKLNVDPEELDALLNQ